MKHVQFIRDIASNANLFVGLDGEITVDTTARELRLHDGTTPGGYGIARKDLANVSAASSTNAGKMTAAQVIVLENAMQRPLTWTTGRLTKFDAGGNPVDSAVTATEAQLNYLSGVTAGTRTVSKAIVVDGSGFIDALGVTTANITNLQLGGVAVTATATELNYTDVTTPGVVQASKAVVVDGSGNISGFATVNMTTLQLGGVSVTATATKLNYTDVTTPGTAQASTALVTDANRNIQNLGNVLAIGANRRSDNAMYAIDLGTTALIRSHPSSYNMTIMPNAYTDSAGLFHYSSNGYSPRINLNTNDGSIRFSVDTVIGVAGNTVSQSDALIIPQSGAITINGNTVWHAGNVVTVAAGGTGATTANGAKENLGIYHGRIDGTGASIRLPSGWSVSRTSAGFYAITHNLGTANYTVLTTRINASENLAGAGMYVYDQTTTAFRVYTFDGTNTSADRDFSFEVILD